MDGIKDIRAKFPQYDDMSDDDLAKAIHGKFYADMPYEEFSAKVGLTIPLADVPMNAINNLLPSAGQFASDMVQPILHPIDTAEGIGTLVQGLSVKAGGDTINKWLSEKTGGFIPRNNPDDVARVEGAADAVGQHYKDRYGGWENIKRTVSNDPVGALADLSLVTPAGELAAARIAGQGSKAARVLSGVSRYTNPMTPVAKVASPAIGYTWRAVSDKLAAMGLEAKAIKKTLDAMKANNLTPAQAQQRMAELGPEGMLADATHGLKVAAGQSAMRSPAARNLVDQRMTARLDAGPARAQTALDSAFGQYQDPYSFAEGVKADKAVVNQAYTPALVAGPPLSKSVKRKIMADLLAMTRTKAATTKGAASDILRNIRDALKEKNTAIMWQKLQDSKIAAEAKIARTAMEKANLKPADKSAQGMFRDMRRYISSQVLDTNVPGLAQANAAHAPLSEKQAMFDLGRKSLVGGHNTVTPGQLVGEMRDVGPAARKFVKSGQRAEIERVISNARRNPGVAIDNITSRDFNGPTISAAIGRSKKAELDKFVDRENTFIDSANMGVSGRNSRTAVLNGPGIWDQGGIAAAASDMAAAGAAGTLIGGPMAGMAMATGSGATHARKGILGKISGPSQKLVTSVADKLTKTGAERDALIRALDTANNMAATAPQRAKAMAKIAAALLKTGTPISAISGALQAGQQ